MTTIAIIVRIHRLTVGTLAGAILRESTLMLDVARNRLHRMELWFSLVTMALAFGALIASLFGMNLKNG